MKFLSNHSANKFINEIRNILKTCDSFIFSVSFIKNAGLELLIEDIENALKRGVEGKILTSTYQNFTDVESLKKFLKLADQHKNFSCHLDHKSFEDNGFHTKGYIFKHGEKFTIIIGSTNITRFALEKNYEWNILTTPTDSEIKGLLDEFNLLWNSTYNLDENLIDNYLKLIEYGVLRWDMDSGKLISSKTHKANYMQIKALNELKKLRLNGIDKALIVAATGSGKTYLAALDAYNFQPKRLLFIVHRDTILTASLNTFKGLFQDAKSYGIFNMNSKEIKADFIFSSNKTMSKNLDVFDPYHFDYIIIDEVHHAIASTYQSIVKYFKPKFLLGLTATPERMDQKNVFEIFDYNLPYELRMREAMINNLIVPFKYYGVKSEQLDYDPNKSDLELIKQFLKEDNIDFIINNVNKYKPFSKMKALAFCRTIEHAKRMSEAFNSKGFKTTYLTGSDNTEIRLLNFKRLQDNNDSLEVIFCVDILNEGVDLPSVNMVLFLRPTESSTVFIQQLGRGLRKFENKEFLTVIDFIGNSYRRSMQIALALGTLSDSPYNDKKMLINLVKNDFKELNISGLEINIDELSKEEILNSIQGTNFNSLEYLKKDYLTYKEYIGKKDRLKHLDFLNNDLSFDLIRIIKVNKSLYNFQKKIEEDITPITDNESLFIEYLSEYLPLVENYSFSIINELLRGPISLNNLDKLLESKIQDYSKDKLEYYLGYVMDKYYSEKENQKRKVFVKEIEGLFLLTVNLSNDYFKEEVQDLLDYGLERYQTEFFDNKEDFKLHHQYTRKQFKSVIREHYLAFREGIKYFKGQLYLFIDILKDENTLEKHNYKDEIVDQRNLIWESSIKTTLENKTGIKLIDQKNAHIFVRKTKNDSGITLPFIYLGKGTLTNPRTSDNPEKSILFNIILDNKIPDYMIGEFVLPK
jgi:superfamily II DNA or RNA helicase/HKD family nuclease